MEVSTPILDSVFHSSCVSLCESICKTRTKAKKILQDMALLLILLLIILTFLSHNYNNFLTRLYGYHQRETPVLVRFKALLDEVNIWMVTIWITSLCCTPWEVRLV